MENSYKKRMQKKKAYIDSRIEAANIDKGIIVLLTGNGKGKSSSAMGMICRALGYDLKVGLVRFLKGAQDTGEDFFLNNHENVSTALMESGFTWDTQDKKLDIQKATETWNKAKIFLQDPAIDLVVIDELTYMINYGYLDESGILEIINHRPENQHVVITGRAASKALIDISDTVSEIQDVKHAFRSNIKAQKGVDY
jgi:cob(I)alamin adenosyltransferase